MTGRTASDRDRWDAKHAAPGAGSGEPDAFVLRALELVPFRPSRSALDLACGTGVMAEGRWFITSPHEVLVKTAASGVCHSDLHVLEAALPMPPPCVLGHEPAGIVEELGEGVTGVFAQFVFSPASPTPPQAPEYAPRQQVFSHSISRAPSRSASSPS